MTTIDYKALAERIKTRADDLDAIRAALADRADITDDPAADLHTVVSLLEGMAGEKPDGEVVAVSPIDAIVRWAGCSRPTVGASVYLHPAPQPQQVEVVVHAGVGHWRAALCVGVQAFGFDAEFSTLEAAHAYADRIRAAIGSAPQPQPKKCGCRSCLTPAELLYTFVVCTTCGNKRCPKADDHRNACSNSNAPGQVPQPERRPASGEGN